MALEAGARVGAYEIVGLIGAGGMGEVYRARDTRLDRQVAIKALPDVYRADADRASRFAREAKLLATLNHPNIAAIYGLEQANGEHFIVMELVEGETLAERCTRGPIPVREALDIAKQIAEALDGAHDQGVIHRDLKPANVKITPNNRVKVLDFGLAKAFTEASAASPSSGAQANSPTLTSPVGPTGVGVLLGTAAYMSPEQARGKPVDKRGDIWAFGCVLYEMLTGRRAFNGEDITETLAAVVKDEPAWSMLGADVPMAIRVLLQRCLEKDRAKRLGDVSTASFVIGELASLAPARTDNKARKRRWLIAAGYALAMIAVSVMTAAIVWRMRQPEARRVSRLELTTSGAALLNRNNPNSKHVAITSDGSRVVYMGFDPDAPIATLLTRRMDQLEATLLAEEGAFPFIDPGGEWIGFVSQRALRKVPVTGGPSVEIAPLEGGFRGAVWGKDGTIIFAGGKSLGLARVSSAGGVPQVLTTPNLAAGEGPHMLPELLPDGRGVLFTIANSIKDLNSAASQVAVLDLRTPNAAPKIVIRGGSDARYVPPGHLVYIAGDSVRAVPFDLDRLEVKPRAPVSLPLPVAVVSGVAGDFDIADDGTVVYVPDTQGAAPQRTLAWVDRKGIEEAVPAPPRAYLYPRISSDGMRVALDIRAGENDIWVWDILRRNLTRVTKDPRVDRTPVWDADGQHVLFASDRDGPPSIWRQRADGGGSAERLTTARAAAHFPTDFTAIGGRRLVLHEGGTAAGLGDVMMLRLDDHTTKVVEPFVKTSAGETNGSISPDGRWLAYQSNDSGEWAIYVRPLADVTGGQRTTVSSDGGTQPRWSTSGRELFYVSSRNEMMAVQVGTSGDTWSALPPRRLFDAGSYFLGNQGWFLVMFDVAKDGRFLMIKPVGGSPTTAQDSLVVVQNWTEELKRLVPTN
jgi:serine/threonine-protein kinase